jgi:hypothetical protein
MPDLIPIFDNANAEAANSIREAGALTDHTKGLLGTVLTYENTGSTAVFLDVIRAEADTDAEIFVYIDTVLKDSHRVSIANPTAVFEYTNKGQRIEPGSIVEVKARHNLTPLGSFRASLFGHE